MRAGARLIDDELFTKAAAVSLLGDAVAAADENFGGLADAARAGALDLRGGMGAGADGAVGTAALHPHGADVDAAAALVSFVLFVNPFFASNDGGGVIVMMRMMMMMVMIFAISIFIISAIIIRFFFTATTKATFVITHRNSLLTTASNRNASELRVAEVVELAIAGAARASTADEEVEAVGLGVEHLRHERIRRTLGGRAGMVRVAPLTDGTEPAPVHPPLLADAEALLVDDVLAAVDLPPLAGVAVDALLDCKLAHVPRVAVLVAALGVERAGAVDEEVAAVLGAVEDLGDELVGGVGEGAAVDDRGVVAVITDGAEGAAFVGP